MVSITGSKRSWLLDRCVMSKRYDGFCEMFGVNSSDLSHHGKRIILEISVAVLFQALHKNHSNTYTNNKKTSLKRYTKQRNFS